ncbi:MAG: hypothetical protein HDR88_00670 [Bacteroides sp.]|nr:hypothetical protein [Bacteroides sp.]
MDCISTAAETARERCLGGMYMQYLREASALLVLLRWALPEPPIVGRAIGTDSHAFLFIINYLKLMRGVRRHG